MRGARPVRATRGSEMTCRSWGAEAALRMLQNNLDPEVAERPDDLVVYGGNGRAARSWEAFDAIVASLQTMAPDDTLLVQSGKPVGVVRTHEGAPRVLIANSLLVPRWATPEHFRELEDAGLMMYGQMTAGSWIYIGTQGILQGTYATFTEVANQHFGGTLAGTITLTGGLGGMGGAQPLAVTGNGGAALCVEVDPWRAQRRLEHGYLDEIADSLDDGIARVEAAKRDRRALSVAVVANCADVLPELVTRGWAPDVVTDQTSAHDALNGYVPHGMSLEEALELRTAKPVGVRRAVARVDGRALPGDGRPAASRRGRLRLRQRAARPGAGHGLRGRVLLPGLRARLHPAAVRPGRRPVPVGLPVRLGGRPRGDRRGGAEGVPGRRPAAALGAVRRGEGARGRGCRRGSAGSATASGTSPGRRSTTWWPRGAVEAPVVIGRDHLDAGSVASPERETEGMQDGTDAVADWPILNALLNTASGATWVSVHHGGGVGIGKSIHAGVVVVADGTEAAYDKVTRVLTNDPGTGVLRHADAGYEIAERAAREVGIRIPMLDGTSAPPWQS